MQNYMQHASIIITSEIEGIFSMLHNLNNNFNHAVQLLSQAKGRIVTTGVGKSGLVGRKIGATLSSIGVPSFYLSPLDALHGDLGSIVEGDVVIMISNSGKTRELLELIPIVKQRSIPIIAIVGAHASPLAIQSTIALMLSVDREACPYGVVPTTSTTVSLVMGDALALCVAQAKGLGLAEFYRNHPHGALAEEGEKINQRIMRMAS